MTGQLHEIGDGVLAWIHDVTDRFCCNVGIIVDDGGLALVDTSGVPSSYEPLAAAVEDLGRPVRTIVITHSHGDHVAGTGLFPEAEVVASAATAAELTAPPPIAALEALHPEVAGELARLTHPAVDRELERPATIGRLSLDVLGGHTGGDLVATVDGTGVLLAGDLCFSGYVPLGIQADFERWLASIEQLQASAPTVVVPGHGPVGGPAELQVMADYLGAVIDAAATGAPIGGGPWDAWHDPWGDRIPGAINRINVEQAAEPDRWPATLLELIG
jgi:cyclase